MKRFFKKLKILFFGKECDVINELLERDKRMRNYCEKLDVENAQLLQNLKEQNELIRKYNNALKDTRKSLENILHEIQSEMQKGG